jgi:hypothetical protein
MEVLVRRAQEGEDPSAPRLYRIRVDPEATVSILKDLVAEQTGIEYSDQMLVYAGTVLPNHAHLRKCGLGDHACVLLFRKLGRGKQAFIKSSTTDTVASSSSSSSSSASLAPAGAPASQTFNAQLGLISQRMRTMISPQVMQPLLEMGFTEARTVKALLLNLLNTEMAMEWLLEHADDDDIDQPLTQGQVLQVSQSIQLAQPAVRTVPEAIEAAIARLQCTYRITGSQYSPQQYHYCYTCNLVDGRGCCLACAKVCHAGHQLSGAIHSDSFYCDCGSNDGPHQCQAMRDAVGGEGAVGIAGLEAVIAAGELKEESAAGLGCSDGDSVDTSKEQEVKHTELSTARLVRRGRGDGIVGEKWLESATSEDTDPAYTFEQRDFACVAAPLCAATLAAILEGVGTDGAASEELTALLRACEIGEEVQERQLAVLEAVVQEPLAAPTAVLRLLTIAVLHPRVADYFVTRSPVSLVKIAGDRLGAARRAARSEGGTENGAEDCLVWYLSLMVNLTSRTGPSPLAPVGMRETLKASRAAWKPWAGRTTENMDVREVGGAFVANACLLAAHGAMPGVSEELVRHLLRVLRGTHRDEAGEAQATRGVRTTPQPRQIFTYRRAHSHSHSYILS